MLMSSPPTLLLMHSRVTYSMTLGSARNSDRRSWRGLSTMPPTPRVQLWPSTVGSLKFKFFDTT
ncbi:MAG: hypothetical protein AUI83_08780 [Armatimonadetes bacterium 13_1_40CM_3_65_7]|nr:MAG: hypothetical protein AUI83_08780 [Armatimonadetes bacterium 13_1_40CM_3_65_7]